MVAYYDLILGLIPLVLVGGAGVLAGIGLEGAAALSIAGLAAVALIGHALFIHNPRVRGDSRTLS